VLIEIITARRVVENIINNFRYNNCMARTYVNSINERLKSILLRMAREYLKEVGSAARDVYSIVDFGRHAEVREIVDWFAEEWPKINRYSLKVNLGDGTDKNIPKGADAVEDTFDEVVTSKLTRLSELLLRLG
jgi:hypothetical protein